MMTKIRMTNDKANPMSRIQEGAAGTVIRSFELCHSFVISIT